MEIFTLEDVSFRYALSNTPAIQDLTLQIEKGEFLLVCGLSGSGKSTLLKLLKPEIAPAGERKGTIRYLGNDIERLQEPGRIGYISQNPDHQIVTDTVWHELSFGLENLNLPPDVIQRRLAEITHYFAINDIFHSKTYKLSGGQKQLLNLAAILVMQPEVVILDEPTAQLDAISKESLLRTIQGIHRDFGITILLCEHNLDSALQLADRVILLDEGKKVLDTSPKDFAADLIRYDVQHKMIHALPSQYRILKALSIDSDPTVSLGKARGLLQEKSIVRKRSIEEKEKERNEPILVCQDLWFRYEKNSPDVVKNLNLRVEKGEIYSILGANGCGKTTLLNLLSRALKPYRGKVLIDGRDIKKLSAKELYRKNITVLAQNPQNMFLTDEVRKDVDEMFESSNLTKEQFDAKVHELAQQFSISHLFSMNPFDLSGGEQQKLALLKILLTSPRILLLDEPTKGMDDFSKYTLEKILKDLKSQGKTIVMVTHDTEFAAEVSDRASMYFDGHIIGENTKRTFFSRNHYYTTPASLISRGILDNAVLIEDVIQLLGADNEKTL